MSGESISDKSWLVDRETLESCVRQCLWHRDIRHGNLTLEQRCILTLAAQAELDRESEVTDEMAIAFHFGLEAADRSRSQGEVGMSSEKIINDKYANFGKLLNDKLDKITPEPEDWANAFIEVMLTHCVIISEDEDIRTYELRFEDKPSMQVDIYTKQAKMINLSAQAELDRENEITDAEIEAGARALFGIACQMDFVLQDDLKAKVQKLDYDEKWAANDAFYRRTVRIVLEAARDAGKK